MGFTMFDHEALINALKAQIQAASGPRALHEIKNVFTKERVKPLYETLAGLPADQKPEFGRKLKLLKDEIDALVEGVKKQMEDKSDQALVPKYDLMLPPNSLFPGTNHVLQKTIDDVIVFFKRFNFKIVNHCELTTTAYCFDVLNIPLDHPGRRPQDTFYVDDKRLLRTQCTASTIQAAAQLHQKNDIRVVSFGNVYRNDTDDATHSHQFTQIDFIWIRPGISLANLKWFMQQFVNFVFASNVKIRFRLSHFPFTEPSIEVDVRCWNCQNGCAVCKQTRWVEIIGSGLLHPVVLKSIGIGADRSGFAAGIGAERLAMIHNEINDIREFYENDFRFNEQFRD